MLRHCGTMPVETERLLLRRLAMEDATCVHRHWAGDEKIQKMYSEPVYLTVEDTQELLRRYISSYEKEDTYRWAVVLKETNECIGQIAYFMVNTPNHMAEMEYCIGRQFHNQGLMTEAARAVVDFGFKEIGLHRVQICHKSNNPASRRVIEKCGAVYEGTLRDFFHMDGAYVDRLYYGILRDEWAASKSAALQSTLQE